MSSKPPSLFDPELHIAKLLRAKRGGAEDFLMQRVVEEFSDRLAGILRQFENIADFGTPYPQLAKHLARLPGLKSLIRIAAHEELLGTGQWQGMVSSPETLGLPDQSCNLIVSGLAIHAINDLPGLLAQVRRALQPDGLFMACLPGAGTLRELRMSLQEAESELTGGISPRVLPFADIRDLGQLLQRAGFTLPVIDSDTVRVRYDNLFALMRDLRAMGATNILVDRIKLPTRRSVFLRAAEIYAAKFSDSDGRIRASFELVWMSGWSPHESQQKPLRPGSAKHSLAVALENLRKTTGDPR